jgi:hypothetical protein
MQWNHPPNPTFPYGYDCLWTMVHSSKRHMILVIKEWRICFLWTLYLRNLSLFFGYGTLFFPCVPTHAQSPGFFWDSSGFFFYYNDSLKQGKRKESLLDVNCVEWVKIPNLFFLKPKSYVFKKDKQKIPFLVLLIRKKNPNSDREVCQVPLIIALFDTYLIKGWVLPKKQHFPNTQWAE